MEFLTVPESQENIDFEIYVYENGFKKIEGEIKNKSCQL